MERILLARGDGYAADTSFDNYEILAEPLPHREQRVFGRKDNGSGGTCYGSHWLALAKHRDGGSRGGYAVLVRHGGGTQVIAFPGIYDRGTTIQAMIALPPIALYGILYSHFEAATTADRRAREDVRAEWANAFVDGRIRKSRVKAGRRTVSIDPPINLPAIAA